MSTIHLRVQRCPNCGYCAPDISKKKKKPEKIIEIVLNFQIKLINNRDINCYTIEDAIKFQRPN
ncbi:MAG: hypothetical protein HZY31_02595 [Methanocaldococcus sp.]|nr:hypothetical protein [Methanocaldococcus sp.]